MPPKRINLEGHRFGFLEVVEHLGFNDHRQALYRARCKCGAEVKVRGTDLTGIGTKQRRRCSPACTFQKPVMKFVRREISQRGEEASDFSKT
jgi:hypothetical protein